MDTFYVLLVLIIIFGFMFFQSCVEMATQEGMKNKKESKKESKKIKVKTLPF